MNKVKTDDRRGLLSPSNTYIGRMSKQFSHFFDNFEEAIGIYSDTVKDFVHTIDLDDIKTIDDIIATESLCF